MAIDWFELVDGHNRMFKTNYEDLENLLVGELKKVPQYRLAGKLGVSGKTLSIKLLDMGLRTKRGGKAPKKDALIALHKSGELAKMRCLAVCKKLKISVGFFYNLTSELGMDYIKRT